jgi:two-component system, chemotaxis family, protein-glutamate methylesterase/glutaminase
MTNAEPGNGRDLVVVGASAGGVEALRALAAHLPGNLEATVLVVLHLPRGAFSALASIMRRSGPLPADAAFDGAPLRRRQIYVAPADHHLIVADGQARLTRGPAENGHRPAIDPLFRSAARAYGSRVIGIVLSGTRDDGAAGLATIVAHGGAALVQDPQEALYASMPASALELVPDATVATTAELGALVALHTRDQIPWAPVEPDAPLDPADIIAPDPGGNPGPPPVFSCPSCQGGLYEIRTSGAIRYHCRVGHVWSPQALLDEQGTALEAALWMALRSLADKSALARRMAAASRARGNEFAYTRYTTRAVEAEAAGKLIADLVPHGGALNDADDRDLAGEPQPNGSR